MTKPDSCITESRSREKMLRIDQRLNYKHYTCIVYRYHIVTNTEA